MTAVRKRPRRTTASLGAACVALVGLVPVSARAAPPSSPAPPSLQAARIRSLVRVLAGIRTFEARFTQIVHDPALDTRRRRTGRVWIARPGKFAWIYEAPSPERIVADGRRIWVYDEELEQATERPERAALGHRPSLLLAGADDVRRLYRITYEGFVGRTAWYVLRPRRPGPFVRIALGLRGRVPVAMRLRDRLGERTDLRFHKVVLNARIPRTRFRFRPPPGTAVLGGAHARP